MKISLEDASVDSQWHQRRCTEKRFGSSVAAFQQFTATQVFRSISGMSTSLLTLYPAVELESEQLCQISSNSLMSQSCFYSTLKVSRSSGCLQKHFRYLVLFSYRIFDKKIIFSQNLKIWMQNWKQRCLTNWKESKLQFFKMICVIWPLR